MSAFDIQAYHYRSAAEQTHEKRRRFVAPIVMRCAPAHIDIAWDAWKLFEALFLYPHGVVFESTEHAVIALLMMAAICEDEESEEEGQL